MTLIVSCVAKDSVLQVSDRRLSMPDGTLVDDAANKALCLWCCDSHVGLAYTGLAVIGQMGTDRWLLEQLVALDPHTRTLEELGLELQNRLTVAFRRLRNIQNRALTVTVTGYRDGLPFWGCVSNQMGPAGEDLRVPTDDFTLRAPEIDWTRCRKAFMAISGEVRAISPALDKRIKKGQRRFYFQSPYVTVGQLVSYVRVASHTPNYGAYVSQNCTAIVVLPNGRFRCRAYPRHATPINFLPHVIGPVALQDITIEMKRRKPDGAT